MLFKIAFRVSSQTFNIECHLLIHELCIFDKKKCFSKIYVLSARHKSQKSDTESQTCLIGKPSLRSVIFNITWELHHIPLTLFVNYRHSSKQKPVIKLSCSTIFTWTFDNKSKRNFQWCVAFRCLCFKFIFWGVVLKNLIMQKNN